MALKSFNCQGKTGLGPFAAVLQSLCLHTSLLQQNTKTTGLKITSLIEVFSLVIQFSHSVMSNSATP